MPATGHTLALTELPGILLKLIKHGPIPKALREGQSYINNPSKTSTIIVTLPEKLPISEAIELMEGLKETNVPLGGMILNRYPEDPFSSQEREDIIRATAEADGRSTNIWIEQEPGSGGKESAEGTIRNLMGFVCKADRPTGDKVYRADPFSVQVNNGNVQLLRGDWNSEFKEELRFFPFSKYKDQVDAASGAFSKLRHSFQWDDRWL